MKKCNVCLEEKELKSFDKVSKNGYRGTCRKCRNEKNTSTWLSKEGNIEKRREYQKEYQKKHRKENEYYQIYCDCLWSLKNKLNSKKENELKTHLESLFTDDMNWENYGVYWEIDHIISAIKMAKLGYTKEEINKLSNLRPMTITENRSRFKLE